MAHIRNRSPLCCGRNFPLVVKQLNEKLESLNDSLDNDAKGSMDFRVIHFMVAVA